MINMQAQTKNKNILTLDDWKFINISDGLFDVNFNVKSNLKGKGGEYKNEHFRLSINFLFVESPHGKYLVDLGLGNLPLTMFKRHDRTPHLSMAEKLAKYNLIEKNIDGIILTHLHYDHIGGYFEFDDGAYTPNFNNIPCYIHSKEWEYGKKKLNNGDAVFKIYYNALSKNLHITECGQKISTGIEIYFTGGHTPGHQIVLFDTNGHKLCYGGDIIATETQLTKNIPFPFDYAPEQTKKIREKICRRALEEKWIFIFDHAPHIKYATLEKIKKNEYIIIFLPKNYNLKT